MSLLNKTNKSKEDIVETRRRNRRDEKLYYKSYPRINDIFTAIWHYLYWTPPRHLSPPIHVENLDDDGIEPHGSLALETTVKDI